MIFLFSLGFELSNKSKNVENYNLDFDISIESL